MHTLVNLEQNAIKIINLLWKVSLFIWYGIVLEVTIKAKKHANKVAYVHHANSHSSWKKTAVQTKRTALA